MHKDRITRPYWGLVLVAIGALFLARNLGLIHFYFTWREYWPVILILVGVAMLLKSTARGTGTRPSDPDEHRGS